MMTKAYYADETFVEGQLFHFGTFIDGKPEERISSPKTKCTEICLLATNNAFTGPDGKICPGIVFVGLTEQSEKYMVIHFNASTMAPGLGLALALIQANQYLHDQGWVK